MKAVKRLDKYINMLNDERIPAQHMGKMENDEYARLFETVRRIKNIKEPAMPDSNFSVRLKAFIKERDYTKKGKMIRIVRIKRLLIAGCAAAAVIVFVLGLQAVLPGKNTDIIHAMEQAIGEIKAYHGIIEVAETNGLNERLTQFRREVWVGSDGSYRITELEGSRKGMVTVNNKDMLWQVIPDENAVYIYPPFPDPFRGIYELGSEIKNAAGALLVEKAGEDLISGRKAVILKVTPDGGDTYRLWVDKETDIPVKRESAMQNGLQISITYTDIEFIDSIPDELLSYILPEGFSETDTVRERTAASFEEAAHLAGFTPLMPVKVPDKYNLDRISASDKDKSVKYTYKSADATVVISQSASDTEPVRDPSAILGTMGDNEVRIVRGFGGQKDITSISWSRDGMGINVYGSISLNELTLFAEGISGEKLLLQKADTEHKPEVEVEVDMAVEENEQRSVDAGHSPWRLDPAYVAQVFASLLMSPEGISGDYPIPYEDVRIIENDGVKAAARIETEGSIAAYVYLERLVRRDDTGIWTVTGYDPR